MEERRKNKRTSIESKLVVKRLDDGKDEISSIAVTDVSKTGIGFTCDDVLQIGAVYESFLTIWTSEVLHAFLQIVRIELKDKGFAYGAVFIGMPEVDASRITVYQSFNEEN